MRYAIKSPDDADFIEYPSVTQLTGQIDKGEALIKWAVNLAVDYIEDHEDQQAVYDGNAEKRFTGYEYPNRMFKDARSAWKNRRNETADIGTELHNIIEMYIKHSIAKNSPLWLDKKQIREYLKDFTPALIPLFMQFYIWVRDNVKQFLESEKPIVHIYKCYGGTCDMVFINHKDEVVLCDLKTKNALYGDDKFQLSAYKDARETMEGEYEVMFYGVKSVYNYKPIRIDRIAVLKIARDFFDMEYKDYTKDYNHAIIAFNHLLGFFYTAKKRRLNNYRARERR